MEFEELEPSWSASILLFELARHGLCTYIYLSVLTKAVFLFPFCIYLPFIPLSS